MIANDTAVVEEHKRSDEYLSSFPINNTGGNSFYPRSMMSMIPYNVPNEERRWINELLQNWVQ